MNYKMLVPGLMAAAALAAAGCGSSAYSGSGGAAQQGTKTHTGAPAAVSNVLKSGKVGGVTVLTNAKGFTLYWFVPDTATKSNCNGSCTTYWPPVKGPATLASGLKGNLGTITRSDGSKQATFDGHPLYTYSGDSKPGQAAGNGLNLSGGVWHEVTMSGAAGSGGGSGGGW